MGSTVTDSDASTASRPKFSAAIEDYVKSIYLLQQEHEQVTTSLLATQLGVAPASVTGMLQRLDRLHLVTYTPYRSVELTELGRRTALEVLRAPARPPRSSWKRASPRNWATPWPTRTATPSRGPT